VLALLDIAYAMGTAGEEGGAAQGLGGMLFPLIMIFVIFYFILIRPQQKKAKQHQEFLNRLKRGDEVITSGGIYGKVTGLTDKVITLEVANNVRIKVSRNQIAGLKEEEKEEPKK
jgi:preprotein translocase subunit YajC